MLFVFNMEVDVFMEESDVLGVIHSEILSHFPMLDIFRRSTKSGNHFITVCAKLDDLNDITLLPNAWITVTLKNKREFYLELLAFNGKFITSESLGNAHDLVQNSVLLRRLEKSALCHGLNAFGGDLINIDLIHEYYGNKLIIRSKDCLYLVKDDGCNLCIQCQQVNEQFSLERPPQSDGDFVSLFKTSEENLKEKLPKSSKPKAVNTDEQNITFNHHDSGEKKKSRRSKKIKGRSSSKSKCPICLRPFQRPTQLEKHMKFHKSKHSNTLDSPAQCPSCQVEVKSRYELNPHFQANHDSKKGCCVECLIVVDGTTLRRHLFNNHFYNVKDRLCPTCGERFSSPLKLRIHVSTEHDPSSSNAEVCDQCGKVFPHRTKLNHHIYHYHNTSRVYPCHSCDKSFMNPMAFYKHVKIHSTVKPWSCTICGYGAVRKDNVRQHVKKVHKLENDKDHVVKSGELTYDAVERKLDVKSKEGRNFVFKDEMDNYVPNTQ